MRVRARYAKTGKLRFVSAIDLGRIWERSLRRADLPIAYSEGFSPHPKVSFPDALTLGYASTGEYAELTFAGRIDLPAAVADLNAALPDGLALLDAVEVAPSDIRLAKWLRASTWDLTYGGGLANRLREVVDAVLEAEELLVGRDRKGEVTEVDLRPALHQLSTHDGVVRATLHHVEPPMRPSEVHLALRQTAAAHVDLPDPSLVTRVAQGQAVPGGLREALSGEVIPPLHAPRRGSPARGGVSGVAHHPRHPSSGGVSDADPSSPKATIP